MFRKHSNVRFKPAPQYPLPSLDQLYTQLNRRKARNQTIFMVLCILALVVFWVALITSWASPQ